MRKQLLLVLSGLALAAPLAAAPATSGTMRLTSAMSVAGKPPPGQPPMKPIKATQTLTWKGNRMRVESVTPMGPTVMIFTPQDAYVVIPARKMAIRSKPDPKMVKGIQDQLSTLDVSKKLKKSGTRVVNGVTYNVYKGVISKDAHLEALQKPGAKVPSRLITTGTMQGRKITVASVIENVKLNIPVAESLFKVPAGYRIQQSGGTLGAGAVMGAPGG